MTSLDLSQPYQRAVAMSLYRKCCESGPDVENWKVAHVMSLARVTCDV
jgi:hypothetical protein